METIILKRVFRLFKEDGKTINLPDPNPQFTPQEVTQFYTGQYPELTTSTIDGPKAEEDAHVYEFKTTMGTKG